MALRQGIATPSCQQSISYKEAQDYTIKPLADLKPPELPTTEETRPAQIETKEQSLSSILTRKQAAWRNLPSLRNSIIAWVQQTNGVVLGENGPELAHAAVGQDADSDATNGQDLAQCRDTSAEKTADQTALPESAQTDQTLGQTAPGRDAALAPTAPLLSTSDAQAAAIGPDGSEAVTSRYASLESFVQ